MENNTHKIFTNRVISTATFFGGPIVAGFMIAKNYKAFGNSDAARNSIFIGIISTLLLFAGMFTIPEQMHILRCIWGSHNYNRFFHSHIGKFYIYKPIN